MQDNLLTNNKFIDPNVYDISNDAKKQLEYMRKKAEFRNYMKSRTYGYEQVNHPLTKKMRYYADGGIINKPTVATLGEEGPEMVIPLNKPMQMFPLLKDQIQSMHEKRDKGELDALELQNQLIGGKQNERFVQEQHTMIHIDSRDRDILAYPDQSRYKIRLPRAFTNVISVQMKSTEFPNTQQLIRSTPVSQANNVISWQNKTDILSNGQNFTYNTTITPGNYTATTLAQELSAQMSTVKRINGIFNNFNVSIDTVTDIVTFESIDYTKLNNPFTVEVPTSGTLTTFQINFPGHGILSIGERISIRGSLDVAGISNDLINTAHSVTNIVNSDVFEIQIDSLATSNVPAGGGTNVEVGKGVLSKLLFSENQSLANILGFNAIDTEFLFAHQNTVEDFKYFDGNGDGIRLNVNKIFVESTTPSIYSIIETTLEHQLQTGDRIFLFQENDLTPESTIIPYTHLYGLTTADLTTEQNELRQNFVAQITDPAGLTITRINNTQFLIPVPFVNIPPIDNEIDNVEDGDENGNIIIRTLNKAVSLAGENFFYIISPQIGGDFLTSNTLIEDVFYKIQLASGPGSIVFNSFIGNPKIFYDSPLPFLDEIEFILRTHDGELVEFNDNDHSFTIEITEAIQRMEGALYSSQIGARI
jgi:SLT domain-containing protein